MELTFELLLKRIALRPTYTIGRLSVEGAYFCDTLEDKVRDLNKDGDLGEPGETKVYGETAIPYGRYRIIMYRSPHFGRMLPKLLLVDSFEDILIHSGNRPKDTKGCILVGENRVVGKVLNSRPWEKKLVDLLLQAEKEGKEIFITIV